MRRSAGRCYAGASHQHGRDDVSLSYAAVLRGRRSYFCAILIGPVRCFNTLPALTKPAGEVLIMADDDDTLTMPAIISRAEAKAAGLKRYFTGAPCPHAHVAERLTSNCACVTCMAGRKGGTYVPAYEKTPRRKAAKAARQAQYRSEGKAKAWRAAYYAANAEKARQQVRAWEAANPEHIRALRRNYLARKQSADGSHTGEDINRIYRLQSGRCAYCKAKVGNVYHVDHIQPLSRGGSNWPANLQILCPRCNTSKHDTDPIDYVRTRGLLL